MSLDTQTLFTVATCITGLLGVFLLVVWVQERSVRALAWWGAAYLMGGSAVALWGVQGRVPFLSPEAPNALLFASCGMIWTGARLFHGRPILPGALLGGAIFWLIAMKFDTFAHSDQSRVVFSSLVIATYTFLTAYELRRERRRSKVRKWLAATVPLLHSAVFLSPAAIMMFTRSSASSDAWFALFALETLLYVVGTAFIVIVMAKERVAMTHKTAAMTDPLTGLFNRRAFFEAADRLVARQARKHGPVSVLVFDLDHFKSINDRFGHAVGDETLKLFANTTATRMRGDDVFGRIGGEEFAAILASPASEAAMVGQRLRAAFAAASANFSLAATDATVSIGVAAAAAPIEVEALCARADAALYRAKANGRNRVEIAGDHTPTTPAAASAPAPAIGEAAVAVR